MSTCAHVVTLSTGEQLLALDPAVTDITACAYVVQSGLEVQSVLPPLSTEDGTAIGFAVLTVWIIAWSFRMVGRALDGGSRNDDS